LCSGSSRNAIRLPSGINVWLRWNPQDSAASSQVKQPPFWGQHTPKRVGSSFLLSLSLLTQQKIENLATNPRDDSGSRSVPVSRLVHSASKGPRLTVPGGAGGSFAEDRRSNCIYLRKMTSNEYQAAYLEALQKLQARGNVVEDPYITSDGVRHVLVNGFPWEDDLVLEEAWGKEAAKQIRKLLSN
jgi:hypothetical protein